MITTVFISTVDRASYVHQNNSRQTSSLLWVVHPTLALGRLALVRGSTADFIGCFTNLAEDTGSGEALVLATGNIGSILGLVLLLYRWNGWPCQYRFVGMQ